MKKYISFLLAVFLLLSMTSAALAVTRDDILIAFPGYEYSSKANNLQLKSGDLHEAPELTEGNCFIWALVADGAAPVYNLFVGGSYDRDIDKVFIRTIHYVGESKEYELDKVKGGSVKDNPIILIPASPYSSVGNLVPDMLEADLVEIILRNDFINEDDESFILNEAQKKLIQMTYSYYLDVAKNTPAAGLGIIEALNKQLEVYTVDVHRYDYMPQAINGTGGLDPWLTHYMQSRYPNYSTEGKDVEDYITYIIGKNGLGLTYDQMYNMLVALNDETAIHTTLDALTGKR